MSISCTISSLICSYVNSVHASKMILNDFQRFLKLNVVVFVRYISVHHTYILKRAM